MQTLRPLEDKFLFSQFQAPPLDDADFSAKPMIMVIGQYSVGESSSRRKAITEHQTVFILIVNLSFTCSLLSNSRNKIHQTWGPPLSQALYSNANTPTEYCPMTMIMGLALKSASSRGGAWNCENRNLSSNGRSVCKGCNKMNSKLFIRQPTCSPSCTWPSSCRRCSSRCPSGPSPSAGASAPRSAWAASRRKT